MKISLYILSFIYAPWVAIKAFIALTLKIDTWCDKVINAWMDKLNNEIKSNE